MRKLNNTAHKILDVSEHYTQTRGFNAFSYKDIQNEIGVKTSSIHYYFPTKKDLASDMVERFSERFSNMLEEINRECNCGIKRIKALSKQYEELVDEGKFCLCGMLASDMSALPETVHEKLRNFFTFNQKFIANAIQLAVEQKTIKRSINSTDAASHFLATLQGGLLIARATKSRKYFQKIIDHALVQLTNR